MSISAPPVCEIHLEPMRLAFSVPTDVKKKAPNRFSEVYECRKCGYGRVDPLPLPHEVSEFYRFDDYYTHGSGTLLTTASQSFQDKLRVHLAWRLERGCQIDAAVQGLLGDDTNKTLCDVGAGRGDLAALFAEKGYQVTAIDPDPEALSAEYRDKFEFLAGSAEELPEAVKGSKYDVVVMSHVLEHCIDPMRALRNVRALLKKSGRLVCEVPNMDALASRDATWEMLDVPRHLHFFNGRSLMDFCSRAGFSYISIEYAQYLRQFTPDYIRTEQRYFDTLTRGHKPPFPPLTRNSKLRSWALLAATAFAPARYKYDSVRLIGVNA